MGTKAWMAGAACAAALVLAAALGCVTEPERPNVVLVVIDAVRADRLSCMGYPKPLTPNVDALASRGALFEEAYSPTPFSGPSYASIFTGLYPHNHGIRTHPQTLEDRFQTLAEHFSAKGYRTAGFYNQTMIDVRWNYDQGFDVYRAGGDSRATDMGMEWIGQSPSRPFFLFLCLSAPHFPYQPPEPFRRRFAGPPQGDFRYIRDSQSPPPDLLDRLHSAKVLDSKRKSYGFEMSLRFKELGYTEEEAQYLRGLYDACIASSDANLGRLKNYIEEAGLSEKTVWVATSDHGELLGEFGLYFNHALILQEPLVHVPLVLSAPGRIPEGFRSREVARSVDILPTLLDLMGWRIPPGLDGVSLLPVFRNQKLNLPALSEGLPLWPEVEIIPAQYHRHYMKGVAGKWRSVRKGEYYMVRIPVDGERSEWELYHVPELRQNPFRPVNRIDREPQAAGALKPVLEKWAAADRKNGEGGPSMDEEAVKALRSLGYLN